MVNANIRKLLESNLPITDVDFTISFTEKGNMYITKTDGTQLKIADTIYVNVLPTYNQLQNKIYITPDNILSIWNGTSWVAINRPSASNVSVDDIANHFISSTKNVENILVELYNITNGLQQTINTIQTGKQVVSNSSTIPFISVPYITILDTSTISGALVDLTIDVINTSATGSVNYQIFIANIIAYQGIIPVGKTISFETQRNNLVIKVNGTGNLVLHSTTIV